VGGADECVRACAGEFDWVHSFLLRSGASACAPAFGRVEWIFRNAYPGLTPGATDPTPASPAQIIVQTDAFHTINQFVVWIRFIRVIRGRFLHANFTATNGASCFFTLSSMSESLK